MTLLNARPKTFAAVLMVLFPISFVIAMPWLREQSETMVHLFGGIAATGTVVASFVLAVLKDQDLDEWHRGAARFSNQWGWLAGGGLVAILQGLPPFQNLIKYLTTRLVESTDTTEQTILFAFMLGFMAVIVAQMICTLALSKGWRSWMTREAS
jgi:hypothetical protein